MSSIFRRIITKKLIEKCFDLSVKNTLNTASMNCIFNSPTQNPSCNLQIYRYKSKRDKLKSKQAVSESEDSETENQSNDDFFKDIPDKQTKVIKINCPSLRVDSVLKTGMGLSRSKIEEMFYEGKIRVNGEKVAKKSNSVQEGDEIDIIKGLSVSNPNFLTVGRIEILSITSKQSIITLQIRRNKSLTIENYSGINSWSV